MLFRSALDRLMHGMKEKESDAIVAQRKEEEERRKKDADRRRKMSIASVQNTIMGLEARLMDVDEALGQATRRVTSLRGEREALTRTIQQDESGLEGLRRQLARDGQTDSLKEALRQGIEGMEKAMVEHRAQIGRAHV